MAEPSFTRKQLRRAVGKAERLDFYRRYDGEVSLTGTPTATSLPSTSLTQSDNHWRNGWAYIASGTYLGQERKITAFAASTDALTLEYALTGAPAAGDKIEITEIWPASQIHECINRSIERASRLWPETIEDTSLVLRKDQLRYTISALARTPFRVQRLLVERVTNSPTAVVGTVTVNGANLEITVTGLDLVADRYNGYKISVYDGTGVGIGTVDDTTTAHLLVTTADFTTAPAAGDLIRLWDDSYQTHDFFDIRNMRLDAPDYPDTMFLERTYPEFYGCRLHLHYISLPAELTLDTSTTTIPREFIIHQTRAFLHEDLISDNRSDSQRHNQLTQYFQSRADDYMARFYAQRPSASQFINTNPGTSFEIEDPLGWQDGR